jgi:3-keto-disaccharide hydrolase
VLAAVLQLHKVPNRANAMKQVRQFIALVSAAVIFLAALLFFGRAAPARAEDAPAGSPAAAQDLFNGRDLEGWHADVPELDKNPAARSPFIVRDGLLVSLGTPGGHLISDAAHENYRLEIEYRFAAKPGNCGVLVHVSKPRALYGMFPQSIEVQMQSGDAGDFWCIKEDITVPDMITRRGPKERWGVDGDKARRIKNLTDGSEKAPGEWNQLIVECLGDQIKVWVNGDLVNHGTNCTAKGGQIALQAEGSEVEFRKVALKPIEKLTDE